MNNRPFYLLITIMAMAGLLTGFDAAIISGALVFVSQHFALQHHVFMQELIVSIVVIGGLFGAFLAKHLTALMGRRMGVFSTALIFLLGTVLISTTHSVLILIVGRFVLGLAVGLASMIAPMYLAEISPSHCRGSSVFFYQLSVTFGFIAAYSVNFIFAQSGNWRAMFAIGIIPALLLVIGVWILPESPRWLLSKNRDEEASRTINQYFFRDQDMSCSAIKNTLHQSDVALKRLFSKPILPLLMTSILLFFFQSFTGINAIFYYAQTIFNHAGFEAKTGAMFASIGLGLANFVAACVGAKLVDQMGRRRLLFYGYVGVIVCLLLMGCIGHGLFGQHAAAFSFVLLFIYTFCFGVSLGGIPYIVMAEIFPLKFRDQAMALASGIGLWGSNIIVLLSFLSLANALGMANVFWLYAVISLFGLFYCWKLLPETTQVSLENLEQRLANSA